MFERVLNLLIILAIPLLGIIGYLSRSKIYRLEMSMEFMFAINLLGMVLMNNIVTLISDVLMLILFIVFDNINPRNTDYKDIFANQNAYSIEREDNYYLVKVSANKDGEYKEKRNYLLNVVISVVCLIATSVTLFELLFESGLVK